METLVGAGAKNRTLDAVAHWIPPACTFCGGPTKKSKPRPRGTEAAAFECLDSACEQHRAFAKVRAKNLGLMDDEQATAELNQLFQPFTKARYPDGGGYEVAAWDPDG